MRINPDDDTAQHNDLPWPPATAADAFAAALDLDHAAREAFLGELEAADPRMAAELRSLLWFHEASGPFLDSPLGDAGQHGADGPARAAAPAPGERVGRYVVERVIARGATAIVCEARQDDPPRRVALKILHCAVAAPSILRRFADEARILARLRHPGIVPIYECGVHHAGSAAPGMPYIAMEFVPGAEPITRAARALGVRGRVELFAGVCDAVQYLHQRGIIHRDLKPSNVILGEPADGPRLARVIDFGVAKITGADHEGPATLATAAGDLIGTLQYMSPEQCDDAAGLDVRSDIYSLGVILYELLTGELPYELARGNLLQAVQTIKHTTPRAPSTIDRRLRGDLEKIILTALAKDPGRRYQSAAALAADLRRTLAHQPIHARPPGVVYRGCLLARRNPALVAVLGAFLIAVVGGVVGVGYSAVRAEHERRVAEEIARFMEDILSAPHATLTGTSVRVVDVLESARVRLDSFEGPPQVEYRLRLALGRAYDILGLPDDARSQFALARGRAIAAFGPDDPRVLSTTVALAGPDYDQSRFAHAESLLVPVLEAQIRRLGDDHLDTAKTRNDLAIIYMDTGRVVQARTLLREALRTRRLLLGPGHPDVAQTLHNLGAANYQLSEFAEAETLFRESLAARAGLVSVDACLTRQWVAELLRMRGAAAEAVPLVKQAAEELRQLVGEAHPHHASAQRMLARLERDLGELNAARSRLRAVLGGLDPADPVAAAVAGELGALDRLAAETP